MVKSSNELLDLGITLHLHHTCLGVFGVRSDDGHGDQHQAIIKSTMQKARVHKGHIYAFGGIISKMCHIVGVPKESLDYIAPLYPTTMDITCTKREDTDLGPILITIEGHRRDDLIMAKMYVLKMLRHTTGGRPSTDWEI